MLAALARSGNFGVVRTHRGGSPGAILPYASGSQRSGVQQPVASARDFCVVDMSAFTGVAANRAPGDDSVSRASDTRSFLSRDILLEGCLALIVVTNLAREALEMSTSLAIRDPRNELSSVYDTCPVSSAGPPSGTCSLVLRNQVAIRDSRNQVAIRDSGDQVVIRDSRDQVALRDSRNQVALRDSRNQVAILNPHDISIFCHLLLMSLSLLAFILYTRSHRYSS